MEKKIFRYPRDRELTIEDLAKFIRKNDDITARKYKPLRDAYENKYKIFRAYSKRRALIKNVFPIPPNIFFTSPTNFNFEPQETNVIFSNIQNDVVNIYYAYIFYEKYYAYNKSFIYIPKAFVILSQYPFFNTFKNFCVEFLHQFKNKLLEIPLEIHLYNIINFIPAPIYSDISMTLFPLNDLGEIGIKCKNNSDLIHYNHQKEYKLSQLSGYRDLEIDISVILNTYIFKRN